jgi:homoserine dehydrogenase
MKTVRIGLLGCGVVGGGVVQLVAGNARALEARVGAPLEIVRALVRDPSKERVSELDRSKLTQDPSHIVDASDIDVVIEVMGGIEPAKDLLLRALRSGKQVVTANKMLLAAHGPELLRVAAEHAADIGFEASVGGGVPVIRALRDSLVSDRIDRVVGIINGTSNYVLTRMLAAGLSFAAAVKEAQDKGYAEADPTLDVGGHDAAHKLVVLAMLAFGAQVAHEQVPTFGLEDIEPVDHAFASRFGFVIKSLAIGKDHGDSIELRVHPSLVRKDRVLANVSGVLNAVLIEGRALGPCLLSGRGAGDLPTAVSVVADVVDVARAKLSGVTGLTSKSLQLTRKKLMPLSDITSRYYLRFQVFDRPGVLAFITGALGREGVSIEQLVQDGGGDSAGHAVQVVMLTHEANEGAVARALGSIDASDFIKSKTRLIRVGD